MKGRKPTVGNVVPMTGDGRREGQEARFEALAIDLAKRLKPKNLSSGAAIEWKRVAPMLAHPVRNRLKPEFIDVVAEYCEALARMRKLRAELIDLGSENYITGGRNGDQHRAYPQVAQLNETWRQWRTLGAVLGMSPADERSLSAVQGSLPFDDPSAEFLK